MRQQRMRTVWMVLACVIIAVAWLLTIVRVVTPHLLQPKPDIEARVSALLGKQVEIAAVRAVWRGISPVLLMQDVRILSAEHQPIVKAAQLNITVNLWRTLIKQQLQFSDITLRGTQLLIQQLGAQRWRVNSSWTVDFEQSSALQQTGWVLAAQNIHLSELRLRWFASDGKPLSVMEGSFSIANRGAKHSVWGSLRLQDEPATELRAVAHLTGDLSKPNAARARLFFTVENMDLERGLRFYPHPVTQRGVLSLQAWLDWRAGQWQSIQGLFNLQQADLQLPYANKRLTLDKVGGELSWQRDTPQAWQLTLRDFHLQLNGQSSWPVSDWQVLVQQATATQPARYQLQAAYLRLQDLAYWIEHYAPESWRQYYAALQPRGELRDIAVSVAPQTPVSFQADFAGLSVAPWRQFPGVVDVSGRIQHTGSGGEVVFTGAAPRVDFGRLFPEKFTLTDMQGALRWQRQQDAWQIEGKNLKIADAALALHGDMALRVPTNDAPVMLDVSAQVSLASPNQVAHYLPIGVLDPHLVHWLNSALVSGDPVKASVVVRGPLAQFPFAANEGMFRVNAQLKNVVLQFHPQWPALTELNGQLLFHNQQMVVAVQQAAMAEYPVPHLRAIIEDLRAQQPKHVQVDADWLGDLSVAQRVLTQSPLAATLGDLLQQATLQGATRLHLNLDVPLISKKPDAAVEVMGRVHLLGNDMRLLAHDVALNQLRGVVHFTNAHTQHIAVTAENITGLVLDRSAVMQVATKLDKKQQAHTQVTLQGVTDVDVLRKKWQGIYWDYAKGETPYTLALDLPHTTQGGVRQLQVHSNLQGITLHVPTLYDKPATQALPFSFTAQFPAGNSADKQALLLRLANGIYLSIGQQQSSVALADNTQALIQIPVEQKDPVIKMQFKKLVVKTSDKASQTLTLDPKKIPSLALNCQTFDYGNRHFGAIELRTTAKPWGMSIDRLTATRPSWDVEAEGVWREQQGKQQTTLRGKIHSQEVTASFVDWDLPSALSAKEGNATFALQWPGAPQAFSLATAQGDFNLDIGKGNIATLGNNTSGQFGKLLSFLSLPSLRRRLQLDFSDIVDKGFGFDVLRGDLYLVQGNATTKNLYLDGSVAYIGFKGRIGLQSKDFSALLDVAPHVTASLPVVAILTGGPVLGMMTWFANQVTAPAVEYFIRNRYRMTGSWSDPKVDLLSNSNAVSKTTEGAQHE